MEFDLIADIRARAVARAEQGVVLGIGDDAALLQPQPGRQLVVATDTLNAGVHFPQATTAADIGWKALAVNLSDLAAMGAQPRWVTLSLSLPELNRDWCGALLDGLFALADAHAVALVGGDTTRGPLSLCVTVIGEVEPGRALRRDAARAGDEVWVSGSLGDAAAALAQIQAGATLVPALRARLDRPQPRLAAGRALAGLAHACIDLSDGLLADLGHICTASGVTAEVALAQLPASPALHALADAGQRHVWQVAGGDDYELCFTAPPAARAAVLEVAQATGVALTPVGRITAVDDAGPAVRLLDAQGQSWQPPRRGYEHFA